DAGYSCRLMCFPIMKPASCFGVDSGPQDRPEAHDRRPLLHRDPPILAGSHREALEAALPGQLRETGEIRARLLRILRERGHRHQAGDRDRTALDEVAEGSGLDPALALLAGEVDLDQDLRLRPAVLAELLERGFRGDRVDQTYQRQDPLDLP